ncbi:MAG: 3-hydroxyacyl-CoA dehydrogenase/enoyl-CoA hydratase family protein [Saprospirales bacterium]|nr:MAG: 3-hydroxyacyl-CoA dehydrogenase/enoyl-CoA hydratase family protein [Saprospirales bacterium]
MIRIKKIAVLGSGVMGSALACHFANCGFELVLLDRVLPEFENSNDPEQRNRVANQSLQSTVKSKPSPVFTKSISSYIKTGNFTDDLKLIADCDWVVEAIIEDLKIKQGLFEKVEQFRKKGSLVSTNTSGIPIHMLTKGRSEDFRKHFLGTHFFNPPRYLRLLEIIPGPNTDSKVVDFFMHFGDRYLGKETVLCKDRPAFIANRIGVFAMSDIFRLTLELGLDISAVDKLTGPALARPGTGTFRLGDLVGLDVAAKVLKGMQDNCPEDKMLQHLQMPDFMDYLLKNNFLGNKTSQGFYKKTQKKDEKGKSVILALNLKTLEYEPKSSSSLKSLSTSKQIEDSERRIATLFDMEDRGAQLIRKSLCSLFAYSSKRIPEIADELLSVDNALKAGFGWSYGPFEYWDIIGLEKGIKALEEEGLRAAEWVYDMKEKGYTSFYKKENGKVFYYDHNEGDYKSLSGQNQFIILDNYRHKAPVLKNEEITLHDIGDGVLCLEFQSKSNAIGEGILNGLLESIRIAEEDGWKGLVIGNNSQNFTVGANLMLIGMMAFQQQWDELYFAVKTFQDATMRCRYSSIPVVAATQGYTFGGGCEMIMHCDATVAAAESYIGLVEVGVGLIPGGGGTKEFAVRLSDSFYDGDVQTPNLIKQFKTIAMGEVATSSEEAFEKGYLLPAKDRTEINLKRNISEAKKEVLRLADRYIQPRPRNDISVLGRGGLATLYTATNEIFKGRYASEHDVKIAHKIAWVLCGGDLTGTQQVSENYLIELEREAFLSLCGEQKTMERIQYMLENRKPLRN